MNIPAKFFGERPPLLTLLSPLDFILWNSTLQTNKQKKQKESCDFRLSLVLLRSKSKLKIENLWAKRLFNRWKLSCCVIVKVCWLNWVCFPYQLRYSWYWGMWSSQSKSTSVSNLTPAVASLSPPLRQTLDFLDISESFLSCFLHQMLVIELERAYVCYSTVRLSSSTVRIHWQRVR